MDDVDIVTDNVGIDEVLLYDELLVRYEPEVEAVIAEVFSSADPMVCIRWKIVDLKIDK